MAIQVIEKYLPKTAAYINWVFKNDSEERGGHHNYVAEQAVINLSTCLMNQTSVQLEDTDQSLFHKLHALDNRPACVLIVKTEEFTDFAEIVDIYGQGCNYPTKKGVESFQVDFDVIAIDENVEEKEFHIVYQNTERNCNITAYNGIEMSTASSYGCDADESDELIAFMDHENKFFNDMDAIAKRLCFDWFENNNTDSLLELKKYNIEVIISSDTLGDENTDEDNQRFIDAVEKSLKEEYPHSTVGVELSENITSGSESIAGAGCDEDIELENIRSIIDNVWSKANY